jgi:hypothetical protein
MTGRAWVLVVGIALCASLAPGCASTNCQTCEDPNRLPNNTGAARVITAQESPPNSTQSTSPYHPLPRTQDTGELFRQLERTHYPTPATVSDPSFTTTPFPGPPEPPAESRLIATPSLQPMPDFARSAPALSTEQAPPPQEAPVVAALRCCLAKQPAEAVAFVEGFDKPNQELLLALLPLAARLSEGNLARAKPEEISAILGQLNSVMAPLRPLAALAITKMCFCRWIEKFGSFELFPPQHSFRPTTLVQVYVELQNFTIEGNGPIYRTRLASSVRIRDIHNQVVWRQDFPEGQPDLSHTPRHDYFLNCSFRVPDLPPGPYTLSIQVIDVPTRRTAERVLDFCVAPG